MVNKAWKETDLGKIPSNWDYLTLDDIKSGDKKSLISGPFGSNISAKFFKPSGVPVIRGNNLSLDLSIRFKDEGFVFIEESKANELNTWAKKNDIIFTAVGTIGQVGLLEGNENFDKYIISNKQIRLSVDENLILPKYSYYWFASDLVKDMIIQRNTGSSVPLINLTVLKSLPVILPPLPEQKAIASVLSSLDDKIDLLHQQNQTLEALAETLFRQWFIEEAKEDWEEKPLSSIANFLNGLACQKYPPKDSINKLPVLKIKDLTSGISENSDWATSEVKPEYIIKNGDVVFAWSASLMVKIWNGEDCILNQHLFKVTSEKYPKWFYYFWCKQHLREFKAIAQSHATTMGHIKRSDLDEAIVLIPNYDELIAMTLKVDSILDKIQLNNNQINSLTKLRNTLLPKLMSGEVRVKM